MAASNLAEKVRHEEAFVEAARVTGRQGAAWTALTGAGEIDATRAASCLLEPEVGNRVLVATVGGRAYVLAVLERAGDGVARLQADGDLEIRSGGRVQIAAAEGFDLVTGKDGTITAGRLELNAVESSIVSRTLAILGDVVNADVGTIKLTARFVDSVLERIHQRVRRVYRKVEEMEQVRAGHLDYRVDGVARVHAGDTVVTADKLVKLDGEQVHIG